MERQRCGAEEDAILASEAYAEVAAPAARVAIQRLGRVGGGGAREQANVTKGRASHDASVGCRGIHPMEREQSRDETTKNRPQSRAAVLQAHRQPFGVQRVLRVERQRCGAEEDAILASEAYAEVAAPAARVAIQRLGRVGGGGAREQANVTKGRASHDASVGCRGIHPMEREQSRDETTKNRPQSRAAVLQAHRQPFGVQRVLRVERQRC